MTATQYPSNSDDDDDLPAIAGLLSGIKPSNVSASENSNSDDDDDDGGFLDIDELLAGVQQKSVLISAKPDSGSTAENSEDGTRDGSPVNSGRLTKGST